MKNTNKTLNKTWDTVVIGSGMGSLTTASLLAKSGQRILVLERNYLPGGCTSSYYRKGYIFESGATTLVGLDEGMPLHYVLQQLAIKLPAIKLAIPMKVHLKNGETLTRHHALNTWIAEAEKAFGQQGQRDFWTYSFKVSQFVWNTSIQQRTFPPSTFADIVPILKNFRRTQLQYAATAFTSMKQLLKRFGLQNNQKFIDFINEQLIITAQNHYEAVNVLFGCTALCYTNFGNYYLDGGLINLVQPFCNYIKNQGGAVLTRVGVSHIAYQNNQYHLTLDRKGEGQTIVCKNLVSGIPINNLLEIYPSNALQKKYKKAVLPSKKLVSAFSMGIGFVSDKIFDCLHHQIHLDTPLPYCNSNSIFISLSHPNDKTRTPNANEYVANISTHVHDPEVNYDFDKTIVEKIILEKLIERGFFKATDVKYTHSSTPKSWESWTYRKYGFVGGYPQYMSIKPWQMLDARLDHHRAYICGDTVYPGQGIPGVTLSGIIAFEKMKRDGVLG